MCIYFLTLCIYEYIYAHKLYQFHLDSVCLNPVIDLISSPAALYVRFSNLCWLMYAALHRLPILQEWPIFVVFSDLRGVHCYYFTVKD
jgi:hypothetical protein